MVENHNALVGNESGIIVYLQVRPYQMAFKSAIITVS